MNLVYPGESARLKLMAVLAGLFWLALMLGTRGLALIYVLLFFVVYLFAQSGWISYLRGNAVKLGTDQFHDLNARVLGCARRLNVEAPPTYILHHDSVFNALATRFLGRNYVVLYSSVLDALDPLPGAVDFYIGHELGHLDRKHLLWGPFLAPVAWLPLLGSALRRAEEYTCDRYGLAACENRAYAKIALAALAAGATRWKKFNPGTFQEQAQETRGFWMSFHELTNDYPWLSKRMLALDALSQDEEPRQPARNPLAYVLALLVPRLPAAGGGLAGLMVAIAMIGILAAIAIPAYQQYLKRAEAVSVSSVAAPVEESLQQPPDDTPATPEAPGAAPVFSAIPESQRQAYAARLLKGTFAVTAPLRRDAELYYRSNGQWPMTAAQIGLEQSIVQVDQRTGASVALSVGQGAQINVQFNDGPLDGKSLLLAPSDSAGRISWTCFSPEIPNELLPPECGVR